MDHGEEKDTQEWWYMSAMAPVEMVVFRGFDTQ
jgi:hypothetical protein